MNISPSVTNQRSHLYHQFFTLRTNALRDLRWAKLTGKDTKLTLLPEEPSPKNPNRKFIQAQSIPIEKIVGTTSRQGDFDRMFRPLNKHLLDRWINLHLTFENDGWPPILVHKVGDHYYVEDGHHRVSVARSLGMAFIDAEIWEYPSPQTQTEVCDQSACTKCNPAKVLAIG